MTWTVIAWVRREEARTHLSIPGLVAWYEQHHGPLASSLAFGVAGLQPVYDFLSDAVTSSGVDLPYSPYDSSKRRGIECWRDCNSDPHFRFVVPTTELLLEVDVLPAHKAPHLTVTMDWENVRQVHWEQPNGYRRVIEVVSCNTVEEACSRAYDIRRVAEPIVDAEDTQIWEKIEIGLRDGYDLMRKRIKELRGVDLPPCDPSPVLSPGVGGKVSRG